MLSMKSLPACLLIGAALLVSTPAASTLIIDPGQSTVTLSGTVGGGRLDEQGTGSLTTTIGGTIDVSVAAGQIQITGAHIDPNVNGNWAPGRNGQATSPADLAGKASAFGLPVTGALRDLLVTASSAVKPLQGDGTFAAGGIVFSFPTNSSSALDFNSFATGVGSIPLVAYGTNQTATVGKFAEAGGTQTLTIALDATFYFSLILPNDTVLRLTGQLVANSGATAPHINGIEVTGGQAKITASQTTAMTRLEGSTSLGAWTPKDATVTASDSSTRTYTVPAAGRFEFFRLAE
jgi:hypothetical protein